MMTYLIIFFLTIGPDSAPTPARPTATAGIPVKVLALKVLVEKCNVCHQRQNPRKVFTDSNMDDLAPSIYKQVFVKKRMPRGNTIKLGKEDQKALTDWLKTRVNIE